LYESIISANGNYILKQRKPVDVCVMVRCGVLFEVRTEFLNVIKDKPRLQAVKLAQLSGAAIIFCVRSTGSSRYNNTKWLVFAV
jgi:hypothetical protein